MHREKIVFVEVEPWETDYLSQFFGSNALFLRKKLTAENASEFEEAEIISGFIYSDLSIAVLAQLPKLRMIATRSTGYDHIALDECRKRKIVVSNVPSYGENTVAEHTFALVLTLSRNVHKAWYRIKNSENFSYEGLQGFDLEGKILGVIGAGHIGMHVIKIARGFGMKVLAFDIQQSKLLADLLNFEYTSLEELLAKSDIVSLHAPYNRRTHHMINRTNIRTMKKGSLLINTGRGGLVETEAILQALNDGTLAGAGLDVLEGEKLVTEEKEILSRDYTPDELRLLITNHMLMNRENVIITPHLAFYSKEALQRILETTRDNIEAFLKGEPINQI